MKSVRVRTVAVTVAAALSLPVSLGVLASQASASGSSPSATDTASPSPSPSEQPFGPGCSKLPQSGNGSAAQMAHENITTAVDNNPNLSMLADAIKKTDLASTLNGLKDSTVFVPTNDAFNKLGTAKKDALLNDRAQLKKVLTYHVVEHKKITKAQLPHGTFTTLEGSTVTTSGSGDSFKVNGSVPIACGNIPTKNATVYIVDGVLVPPTATPSSSSSSQG
ncbi:MULTISPECIES: fasciclin domain-containing protein [Streptomyces]|uniref:Secreted protein n=1 Tax=Streptomyces coelicolor (strain ATCC BAA-471 / A3(2) / M145) TaxID=100226 RepID=O86667_STRCO|nr:MULTISPECIES: fasciclin domain-containing protein [Streptomyces]MDX2928635.1 fasciclin domain-containing protein [Streptomyces sp. NRRL_B-16638]MDX3350530.1 fasciclin domain-containing protein [Streptomyces sp. ME02-6979A]MDX3371060.1 fasciclin domain-containing protein [Streptomyces sp. ME02-6987-2C]MDX3398497.1 fasciclin domain-containing protein [Streptomyces sp. ME01-18h]MDX3404656.1 fasciclin domain-containing protein [Streptomyces sp. ME02-6977A]